MKTVIKPWGKEEWLELNDRYCYKRIYINAGHRTSLQYHHFKKETNYLIAGEAEIWLENDQGEIEKKIMKAGEYFNVTPPKKHRVVAITDIILQEVSTPEVDDVIRVEDDNNRKDGKIEGEHKTPAVLILAAGEGTRLGNLTKNINKALIPINNKAIISYIIEQFPVDYEVIIALGYQGESLKEYCEIAHPERKFQFVEIDDISKGPGYSASKCKELLQRPFYFTTADCILKDKLPLLDGNWIGVFPTSYPEKYSTARLSSEGVVLDFTNKGSKGHSDAFIGVSAIWDYEIFWEKLGNASEIVRAFYDPITYPVLMAKTLSWLDTGNLDDLNKAKEYFNDKPMSLYKETSEITYRINDRFIKFNSNIDINKNRTKRATSLENLIPWGFKSTKYFISYNWSSGKTLYIQDDYFTYKKFAVELEDRIKKSELKSNSVYHFEKFYKDKTQERVDLFLQKYGKEYLTKEFTINDKKYPTIESLISNNRIQYEDRTTYNEWHGDCQFDNIIEDNLGHFVYIDWRESFAGVTNGGDFYYDLAKMYGGSIIPYNIIKDESTIHLFENGDKVEFSFPTTVNLKDFREHYEKTTNFDLKRIKLTTAIIFLNMAPLHSEKFGKALWFKAIEMLYEYQQGN